MAKGKDISRGSLLREAASVWSREDEELISRENDRILGLFYDAAVREVSTAMRQYDGETGMRRPASLAKQIKDSPELCLFFIYMVRSNCSLFKGHGRVYLVEPIREVRVFETAENGGMVLSEVAWLLSNDDSYSGIFYKDKANESKGEIDVIFKKRRMRSALNLYAYVTKERNFKNFIDGFNDAVSTLCHELYHAFCHQRRHYNYKYVGYDVYDEWAEYLFPFLKGYRLYDFDSEELGANCLQAASYCRRSGNWDGFLPMFIKKAINPRFTLETLASTVRRMKTFSRLEVLYKLFVFLPHTTVYKEHVESPGGIWDEYRLFWFNNAREVETAAKVVPNLLYVFGLLRKHFDSYSLTTNQEHSIIALTKDLKGDALLDYLGSEGFVSDIRRALRS